MIILSSHGIISLKRFPMAKKKDTLTPPLPVGEARVIYTENKLKRERDLKKAEEDASSKSMAYVWEKLEVAAINGDKDILFTQSELQAASSDILIKYLPNLELIGSRLNSLGYKYVIIPSGLRVYGWAE